MSETPKFSPKSQESETERRSSRREFLKKMLGGAAALGFIGLETWSDVSETEAFEGARGLADWQIREGFEKYSKDIKDPNNYLRFLKGRETIIPDIVFDAYTKTVDKISTRVTSQEADGAYLSENCLYYEKDQQEFQDRLKKFDMPQEQIDFYQSLLSSTDLIILRESYLESEYFLAGLLHERRHQALVRLGKTDSKIMEEAAKEIISRKQGEHQYLFVQEQNTKGESSPPVAAISVLNNWHEFYTYLSSGDFGNEPEKLLAREYPKAYQIYQAILESTKLTE